MNIFNNKKMFNKILYFIILLLVFSSKAFAHKVSIFAWVEGNTVHTESKFSGGKKVKNAKIEVLDINDNIIHKGMTDANGNFSFKVKKKMELKIVLIAGMGHKAYWIIPIEDFTPDNNSLSNGNISYEPIGKNNKKKEILNTDCISSENLENIVEKVIDKKMTPLIKKVNLLLNPNKSPKFSDILGGIGYIIGLVGLGAYLNYRNKLKGK